MMPNDGSGVVKIACKFDLSGLRAGEHRRVEEALLVWSLTQVPSGVAPEFSLHSVTSAWTKSSVESGAIPQMDPTKIADWQVNLAAPESKEGRLVRLDLTTLVENWVKGNAANYGVVATTPDVPLKTLTSQFGKVQLIVRYGFRDF